MEFARVCDSPKESNTDIYLDFQKLQLTEDHGGEGVQFNLKTIWNFLLRLLTLTSWWLDRCRGGGGRVLFWQVRGDIWHFLVLIHHISAERVFPVFFGYFWVIIICVLVSWFASSTYCLVVSGPTASCMFQLQLWLLLSGKMREFLVLRSLCASENGYCFSPEPRPAPTACWFSTQPHVNPIDLVEKRWL